MSSAIPGRRSSTNKFIVTANIEAADGGKTIIGGNERVIRARLSDAKFFYETDLKTKLEDRLPKFEQIVFHEKLGTQAERIKRIERLAAEIAPLVGADVEKTKRAAHLAKADLLTEVVGEFPELQGLMGKYYALAQGEDTSVAAASEEHYKPQGPADRVPTDPVSVAVALADKIDTLVGFWAIDEKPTGSKDPYALRRAALGIIRTILERGLQIPLRRIIAGHHPRIYQQERLAFRLFLRNEEGLFEYPPFWREISWPVVTQDGDEIWPVEEFKFRNDQVIWVHTDSFIPPEVDNYLSVQLLRDKGQIVLDRRDEIAKQCFAIESALSVCEGLLAFFADRLKVQLREQGARHDLVDAVFSLDGQDDLLMVVRRVEALGEFLDTDDGKNLLAGTKRASNILAIEEKRDKRTFDGAPNPALYRLAEEKALADAIDLVKVEASVAVMNEDFASAMSFMATLRPAVDAFFEHVKVNDDDPKVRENRLKLLNEIRGATRAVADFSRIEG